MIRIVMGFRLSDRVRNEDIRRRIQQVPVSPLGQASEIEKAWTHGENEGKQDTKASFKGEDDRKTTQRTIRDAMGPSYGEGPRECWRATGGGAMTSSRPQGVEKSRVRLMPMPIGGKLSQSEVSQESQP